MNQREGPEKTGTSDSFSLDEIREGVVNVKMLRSGGKAVIIRHGEQVRVFGDTCPHMGADLGDGIYCSARRTLSCPWHGYVFDATDGRFIENPNEAIMRTLRTPSKHFQPDKTPRYRLPILPFRVEGSTLYIGAGERRS